MTLDARLQRAVLDYRGMAESVGWRHIRRLHGAEADEILSIALEALVQAAAKWIPYCAARGFDPWSADDPGRPEAHFGGYAVKRVNGMILDWCRHQDHVTRSVRGRLKAIAAALEAGARTEAELAAATGLPAAQIREALAADAVKPVSLDDNSPSADFGHQGLADGSAGTESAAVVRETLASFVATFDALPAVQQVLLAFVYHREVPLEVAGKELGMELAEAQRLHDEGVLAIHDTLLLAVQAEGTGPRRPAPPLPPVRDPVGGLLPGG